MTANNKTKTTEKLNFLFINVHAKEIIVQCTHVNETTTHNHTDRD